MGLEPLFTSHQDCALVPDRLLRGSRSLASNRPRQISLCAPHCGGRLCSDQARAAALAALRKSCEDAPPLWHADTPLKDGDLLLRGNPTPSNENHWSVGHSSARVGASERSDTAVAADVWEIPERLEAAEAEREFSHPSKRVVGPEASDVEAPDESASEGDGDKATGAASEELRSLSGDGSAQEMYTSLAARGFV